MISADKHKGNLYSQASWAHAALWCTHDGIFEAQALRALTSACMQWSTLPPCSISPPALSFCTRSRTEQERSPQMSSSLSFCEKCTSSLNTALVLVSVMSLDDWIRCFLTLPDSLFLPVTAADPAPVNFPCELIVETQCWSSTVIKDKKGGMRSTLTGKKVWRWRIFFLPLHWLIKYFYGEKFKLIITFHCSDKKNNGPH